MQNGAPIPRHLGAERRFGLGALISRMLATCPLFPNHREEPNYGCGLTGKVGRSIGRIKS